MRIEQIYIGTEQEIIDVSLTLSKSYAEIGEAGDIFSSEVGFRKQMKEQVGLYKNPSDSTGSMGIMFYMDVDLLKTVDEDGMPDRNIHLRCLYYRILNPPAIKLDVEG